MRHCMLEPAVASAPVGVALNGTSGGANGGNVDILKAINRTLESMTATVVCSNGDAAAAAVTKAKLLRNKEKKKKRRKRKRLGR